MGPLPPAVLDANRLGTGWVTQVVGCRGRNPGSVAMVSWLPGFILEARPRPRSLLEGARPTLAINPPSSPAEQGSPLPCQGPAW